MSRWIASVSAVCLLLIAAAEAMRGSAGTAADGPSTGEKVEKIRRGEYLVNSVAHCVQCHTPRNERGELLRSQLLQGAPMPATSPWPDQKWALRAPPLDGLPGGWSEQDVINFLMTGEDPTGRSPQPPMPPFRMNRQDAAAVAAYLRSLPHGSGAQDSGR
jgi:mono/diheme cytochrome c family protein